MIKIVEIEDSQTLLGLDETVFYTVGLTIELSTEGEEYIALNIVDADFGLVYFKEPQSKEKIFIELSGSQKCEILEKLGKEAKERFSEDFPSLQILEDQKAEAHYDRWANERDEREL